jgi:RNA polymerase sigma-70 factor, ECF subfamily
MSVKKDRSLAFGTLWGASKTREAAGVVRDVEEQVETCFRQHAARLVSVLVARYGSPEDAEDVIQEAFFRLCAALRAAETSIEHPAAWVASVANRLMLDRLRHGRIAADKERDERRRLVDALMSASTSATPERIVVERQRIGTIKSAARALSDVERTCLNGRAEGLTLAQIADRERLTIVQVHRALARAVQRLREALRE